MFLHIVLSGKMFSSARFGGWCEGGGLGEGSSASEGVEGAGVVGGVWWRLRGCVGEWRLGV